MTASLFTPVPALAGTASATPAAASTQPVLVLESKRGWSRLSPRELWHYRDLLRLLARRDIQVRYKQTMLGAAWAVLQPLVSMLVLSLVFGRLLGVADRVGGVPYAVFLYAGLLPWTFFTSSVTAQSGSLVGSANLLGKVYFPRLIVPLASMGAPLVDYAIASIVLAGLMAWYGLGVGVSLLLMPLLVLSTILAGTGVGLGLAAMTVAYRDIRYVVPFVLQVGFFLTPIIAPVNLLPPAYRWVLVLNPMAGTITGFRSVILQQPVDYALWAGSVGMSLVLLLLSLTYFARSEHRFADIV